MRILIAPNAFKNSLNAELAAFSIRKGFSRSALHCDCECFPIGDGGDGTGSLIVKKLKGNPVTLTVPGPLGKSVKAPLGFIDGGKTAVIEMADASGLKLLSKNELDPLKASSYGTGIQIKHALDEGVKKIIIGMGGTATVDGGTGILRALGVRFLNKAGHDLYLPAELKNLEKVELSGIDQRILKCEIIVLCDVSNMLLGKFGSAAVFGPQKGASPTEVQMLDSALARLSNVTYKQTGKNMAAVPSGGTAGGAAAGLNIFLAAKLVNGIEYFLRLTGFDKALEKTDLVVTGEGYIDEQTLKGKGPFGVAIQAKKRGLAVIAMAGGVPIKKNKVLNRYFDVLLAIGNEPSDLQTALDRTSDNLTRVSCEVGNLLARFPLQGPLSQSN